MRFSEVCLRRPTTLVMASLLLAGFFGYSQIAASEAPTVTVTVEYPGASAETMAISVGAPLERQFSTIQGVVSITSSNHAGLTEIVLEFDPKGSIDAAGLDVQSAISAVSSRLPKDLPSPPVVAKGDR